jgi:hypothetical protein
MTHQRPMLLHTEVLLGVVDADDLAIMVTDGDIGVAMPLQVGVFMVMAGVPHLLLNLLLKKMSMKKRKLPNLKKKSRS